MFIVVPSNSHPQPSTPPKNKQENDHSIILRLNNFKKIEFFGKILFKLIFVLYCPLNSCKKIRKILNADSEKKRLLTNGLTDNTEFTFSSRSDSKLSYTKDFVLYGFLWNLTAIFNFRRWLLVKELQDIFYSIFSDSSSRLQMFFKISVLKNFAILTGKYLCWGLFLIKLQGFSPAFF